MTNSVTSVSTLTSPTAIIVVGTRHTHTCESALTRFISRNPAPPRPRPVAMTGGRPIRPATEAASGAAPPTSNDGATAHSAATNGRSPRTCCRYPVIRMLLPISAACASRLMHTEAENPRFGKA